MGVPPHSSQPTPVPCRSLRTGIGAPVFELEASGIGSLEELQDVFSNLQVDHLQQLVFRSLSNGEDCFEVSHEFVSGHAANARDVVQL